MSSTDISNILKQLDELAQPKQLPALFKPHNISPVLGSPEKKNPMSGYFVGGEGAEPDAKPVWYAIRHRDTGHTLSSHEDEAAARDEMAGLGDRRQEYKLVKTSKRPNQFGLDEAYDAHDEGDVWYRFDPKTQGLRQRTFSHADERQARGEGWKESHAAAMREQGFFPSKYKKGQYVKKGLDGKWITVNPYGTQGVEESDDGQQYAVTIDAIDHGVLSPITVTASNPAEAKQKAIASATASMAKRGYELQVRSAAVKPAQGMAEGMNDWALKDKPKAQSIPQTSGMNNWARKDIHNKAYEYPPTHYDKDGKDMYGQKKPELKSQTEGLDKEALRQELIKVNQQMKLNHPRYNNPNSPGHTDRYFALAKKKDTILAQLKQGVAEGSLNESDKFTSWYDWKDQAKSSGYTITKKDDKIVALNKQGQVVGHWSDVGKFLSGKAPRPNFKRPVEQGVAEALDKEGDYHVSVQKGKFLPSDRGGGSDENLNYLHDLMNISGTGGGPMLVTISDPRIATEVAAMYGGKVLKTRYGTYRIVQSKGQNQKTPTPEPELVGMREDDVAEALDPDTQRLEQEVRDALANGDDYTAKSLVKMAQTAADRNYLRKIIRQEMYGTGPSQGGIMEGDDGQVVFSGTGANGGKYKIIQTGPTDFMIHANGKHIDTYSSLQRAMSVLKNEVPGLTKGMAEGSSSPDEYKRRLASIQSLRYDNPQEYAKQYRALLQAMPEEHAAHANQVQKGSYSPGERGSGTGSTGRVSESSENRCMQCGMKNCKCPGNSCKCKPIAGWIPNKGFKAAVDESSMAEEASPMIKPPSNRFDSKQEAFAHAKAHGGKVFKSTYKDPNTGNRHVSFVVKKDQDVEEVAPPGAKAERMVKHIKQGYARDGKLTGKEKAIAYATTWKAHNRGQVEEASEDQVGFHLDTERAYNAVMERFGDVVEQDQESGMMTVPRRYWLQLEQVAHDADGIGAIEAGGENIAVDEVEESYWQPQIDEAIAQEDVLDKEKRHLGDYLQSVADAVKHDAALSSKDTPAHSSDTIGSAVKTVTTDDGHDLKIHGNEDDGFRISIKGRPSRVKFKSLDEAGMACEMYRSHRRHKLESADYIEEQ